MHSGSVALRPLAFLAYTRSIVRREIIVRFRGDPQAQPSGPLKRFLMSALFIAIALAVLITTLALGLSLMLIIWIVLAVAVVVAIVRSFFSSPDRTSRL